MKRGKNNACHHRKSPRDSAENPRRYADPPTTDRVKEALFSVIQFDIPGSRVLDLFGGTGQLGLEALEPGRMKSAVFVDAREDACKLIRENLKRTRLQEDARVVRSDYLDYLSRCREQYDIIFLDPPYAEVFLENSLNRITEIDILHSGGIIVAERRLGRNCLGTTRATPGRGIISMERFC